MIYIERIETLLKEQDKRKKDLAKILDCEPTTISKYLNNSRNLKIDDLIKICVYLNASPEYILGFTNKYKPLPKK